MGQTVIGVTPLWDAEKGCIWMWPNYLAGLEAFGAVPVILPLAEDAGAVRRLLFLCDGVLFTGGQDVSPQLYGEEKRAVCGEICDARDIFEQNLLHLALEQDKPSFGICRGLQFFNVCLGGTLYQDLPAEHPSGVVHTSTPTNRATHMARILPDTPLHSLLEISDLRVNSYHHQGIKDLAPSLREMVRSEDDVIEAVYLPDKRFAWAVQWHPERSFAADECSRKIFAAFVDAAAHHTPR